MNRHSAENTQPVIKVGIVSAPSLHFCLNAEYICRQNGMSVQGESEVVATDTALRWNGEIRHELLFEPKEAADASFSLYDVTIGVNFHWERKEKQTFRGSLLLLNDDGKVCAINILPLEEYLKSVISSEMSSTASLQFLKAHAVISRSWLMAQIQKSSRGAKSLSSLRGLSSLSSSSSSPLGGRLGGDCSFRVKWYDREDHRLFDVCADDHCQRYQGITKISNPTAVEAVNQTCGEVLMYDGEICDARFSKCCGGVLEEFASCWGDENKPYLVSKPDIIFDERSRGINEAFCNTSDPAILSQVLNDFDQETTDFYRWNVEYTGQQLDELVMQKSGIDFGHILSLTPVKRGPSGRIILLEIQGTKQTVTVGKELEIRRWLSPSHLYSSAFEVIRLKDGFRLEGRGWGHGVGLCQIGAAVMGSLGYDYNEILSHYYPNAEIKDI